MYCNGITIRQAETIISVVKVEDLFVEKMDRVGCQLFFHLGQHIGIEVPFVAHLRETKVLIYLHRCPDTLLVTFDSFLLMSCK